MDLTSKIQTVVEGFDPIGLEGMNQVMLQNRKDTKHVFALSTLPEVLKKLQEDYYVMDIEGNRIMQYKTLYYDTPDFDLYTSHHNGKLNRYKFRSRTYVETDNSFFEIKFKNNRGRTIKKRVGRDEIEIDLDEESIDFINEIAETDIDESSLEAKLWVYYKRITLTDRNLTERVTVDINLGFEGNGEQKDLHSIAIIELKQDKFSTNSVISELLREMKISEFGFSKYCIGIASVYDEVKKNRFKPKFRQLKKITSEQR